MAVRSARLAGLTGSARTLALPCAAQVTPAAGYTPPDDTPSIRVGATSSPTTPSPRSRRARTPTATRSRPNAFNVGRAYINVTGNISHLIAFRVTPDITRETGTGSSLNGSYTFRLKYAYAQFNLDDWMTARLVGRASACSRRRGSTSRRASTGTGSRGRSSPSARASCRRPTSGASFHYNFPATTATSTPASTTARPTTSRSQRSEGLHDSRHAPAAAESPVLRGLRVTGFYDHDAYVKNADRRRGIVAVTFEHPYLNAAFEYLSTDGSDPHEDGESRQRRAVVLGNAEDAPMGGKDCCASTHLEPDKDLDGEHVRASSSASPTGSRIRATVTTALLFDFENVDNKDFTPPRPDERRSRCTRW